MSKMIDYLAAKNGINRPGEVSWFHAANSIDRLDQALAEPAMVVESDICHSASQDIAIAVHPPRTESDLTFAGLLNRMRYSEKGLKLDLKDYRVLVECLKALLNASLPQPVLLNADILRGNGAEPSEFNPSEFFILCEENYPQGIFSVGWTTTADPNLPYTAENIDEMLAVASGIDEVTFPVRACLLPNSWSELERLLAANPTWTLTVWNNEPVSDELATWIRTNTNPARTYYDFIDPNKDPMKLW
jgi:hypothetical protein